MYSNILEGLQTKDDLLLLKEELEKLKLAIFQNKNDFNDVLDNKIRRSISERIKMDLQNEKTDPAKYIEGFEEELKKIVEVKLVLARELNGKTFSSVYQWFLDNMGIHVVLDIHYKSSILGGAEVSLNGKFLDGSLTKKIASLSQE